jgi:hypothetical protein
MSGIASPNHGDSVLVEEVSVDLERKMVWVSIKTDDGYAE